MTRARLATRCGTTQSWISELENGKTRGELEPQILRELKATLVSLPEEPALLARRSTRASSNFDVTDLVNMPCQPNPAGGVELLRSVTQASAPSRL